MMSLPAVDPVRSPLPTWAATFASPLRDIGGEIAELIRSDRGREVRAINMIASASYCPISLRQAEGSHLVNKNVSGWPGSRSMANCEDADRIERLAIDRARVLFGAEAVNVQALSSTLANVAVVRAVLKPGDRLLAFGELAGGHVSHGTERHITSAMLDVRTFGVDASGALDLEEARRVAREFRPSMIVAGATSYPREIPFAELRKIADEVGALLFSDIAHVAGLVVAGLHANPVPFSDIATTSTQKTLCGPRNGSFTFSRSEFAEAIDKAIYPGLQGPAPIHLIAARALQLDIVARPEFSELMRAVVRNAKALSDGLRETGIELYTGGTDTHMVVAEAPSQDWSTSSLVDVMGRYRVTGNGIGVPRRQGAANDAAFRFGSVAMTIRGLGETEFLELGSMFGQILRDGPAAPVRPELAGRLGAIAESFPIPSYVD